MIVFSGDPRVANNRVFFYELRADLFLTDHEFHHVSFQLGKLKV